MADDVGGVITSGDSQNIAVALERLYSATCLQPALFRFKTTTTKEMGVLCAASVHACWCANALLSCWIQAGQQKQDIEKLKLTDC